MRTDLNNLPRRNGPEEAAARTVRASKSERDRRVSQGEGLGGNELEKQEESRRHYPVPPPQQAWPRVFPQLSVLENLQMGAYLHGGGTKEAFERVYTLFRDASEHTKEVFGVREQDGDVTVLVGSQLRARFAVESVTDVDNGGVQVEWSVTLERQGSERPVCVAEFITRHYF